MVFRRGDGLRQAALPCHGLMLHGKSSGNCVGLCRLWRMHGPWAEGVGGEKNGFLSEMITDQDVMLGLFSPFRSGQVRFLVAQQAL